MAALPKIITIDGEAHTGKSLAAFNLARTLEVFLLNTGAMYRTVAHELLKQTIDFRLETRDAELITKTIAGYEFRMNGQDVTLNGVRVPEVIFDVSMNAHSSLVAKLPEVRLKLQQEQRRIQGEHPHIICEGRDQGTVVFPSAELKFYFVASLDVKTERAAKKKRELNPNETIDLVTLRNQVEARDQDDKSRLTDPLKQPQDAHVIDTSELNPDQVLALMMDKLNAWRSRTI
ncbi:MAG: (d)CMP kinase [Fimbriiglobus sp.]